MRRAKVIDAFRRLVEKQQEWPLLLSGLSFQGIPSLGTGDIPISSPLTVLCGYSGTGKTTLLRASLSATAPNVAKGILATLRKLQGGSLAMTVRRNGATQTYTAQFTANEITADPEADFESYHIDTSAFLTESHTLFSVDLAKDELLNGIARRALTADSMTEVNFLARRTYDEVGVFEYEVETGAVPFFEVRYGDHNYDSRSMGSGELAVLALWWFVDRSPRDSFLFIEEPETFMSPLSQSAFAAHLAKKAYEKKLNVLMTSHSSTFLRALGSESLRLLERRADGVRVTPGNPHPAYLEMLGIESEIEAIIAVEDKVARDFARFLLDHFDPLFASKVEFSVCNGESGVKKLLEAFDHSIESFVMVGLFDGDQRGKVGEQYAQRSTFLPGSTSVELMYMDLAKRQRKLLSDRFGNDVDSVLASLEGSDQHDWLISFGRKLGMDGKLIGYNLFRLWVEGKENLAAAGKCYEDLLRLCTAAAEVNRPSSAPR